MKKSCARFNVDYIYGLTVIRICGVCLDCFCHDGLDRVSWNDVDLSFALRAACESPPFGARALQCSSDAAPLSQGSEIMESLETDLSRDEARLTCSAVNGSQ